MNARVPQDVDLEDRLVFGLTPVRFGYVVIAGLAALSLWKLEAAPGALRIGGCLLVIAAGSLLAWGRWRARPLDCWVADAAVFVVRNYQVGLPPLSKRRRPARCSAIPLAAVNALAGADREPGEAPS